MQILWVVVLLMLVGCDDFGPVRHPVKPPFTKVPEIACTNSIPPNCQEVGS